MRILFITPRFPYPPNRGDKLRIFNFAKVLSPEHSLSLVSFIETKDEESYLPRARQVFESIELVKFDKQRARIQAILSLFSRKPLQVGYFSSPLMEERVKRTMASHSFDLVYVFHLRMAQYLKGFGSVYKVLDFTDSISLFLRRMLRCSKFYLKPFIFREWLAIKRYESLIAAEFDECWVVSPVDKEALGKLPVPIKIIPNGVEPQYFRLTPTTDNDPNILFVGYMGMESIDAVMYFLNKIFPLIHASIPHVKFYIVGANPPSSILKLAQNPNIVVTGFVENLLEYYSKASVVVAPMRFVAGVQNKVLEAMAAGVPVVASSLANAGIGGIHAEHLFVADEPVQFAEYVIYLLQNLKVRARIGSNARAFIKERFSWHAVVKRVDEIRKCLRV